MTVAELSLFDLLALAGVQLPDFALAVMVAVCLWYSMLTNGLEHAMIYADSTTVDWLYPGLGLHSVDLVQEWAYYGLVVLTGIPLLSCFGAAMAGRVFFQGPINVAASGGWWKEPDEPVSVSFFGYETTKTFVGRARIAQSFLGLLLFVYPFLV